MLQVVNFIFGILFIFVFGSVLIWYYGARMNKALNLLTDPWMRDKIRYQGGLRQYGNFHLPTINFYNHFALFFLWLMIFFSWESVNDVLKLVGLFVAGVIILGNIIENALKWLIVMECREGVYDPWQNSFLVVDTLLCWFLPVYFIGGMSIIYFPTLVSPYHLFALFLVLAGFSFLSYLVLGFTLDHKLNQVTKHDEIKAFQKQIEKELNHE